MAFTALRVYIIINVFMGSTINFCLCTCRPLKCVISSMFLNVPQSIFGNLLTIETPANMMLIQYHAFHFIFLLLSLFHTGG